MMFWESINSRSSQQAYEQLGHEVSINEMVAPNQELGFI